MLMAFVDSVERNGSIEPIPSELVVGIEVTELQSSKPKEYEIKLN